MKTVRAAVFCAAGLASVGLTSDAQAKGYTVDCKPEISSVGDETDICYPVVECGTHADEFPMVVLLPGGNTDKSLYSDYARELAKHGYVVAVANHLRPVGPPGTPPGLFSTVNSMVSTMQLLQQLDANPSSELYQIVDEENLAIQGHSYGGGVALYAVEGSCGPMNVFCDSMGPMVPVPYARPPELKVAILWASSAYSRGFGPVPILLDPETSAVPVAIFSGGNDQGSPVEDALDTYPLLDGTKAVLEFEGMTHYGICNMEDPPGNTPDAGEPEVHQEEGHKRIAKWSDRFFKAHLDENKGMLKRIYKKKKGDKGVVIVEADL